MLRPFAAAGFLSLAIATSVGAAAQAAGTEAQTKLLFRQPALSREAIVFVLAGDLWTVPRAGGEARRLTASDGLESEPALSPDGRWIAFARDRPGVALTSCIGERIILTCQNLSPTAVPRPG